MTAPANTAELIPWNSAPQTGKDIAIAAACDLERKLESLGWQLLSVEVDVIAETARIELAQGALRVMLDARNGRASITREMMICTQHRIGRKGDFMVVRDIAWVFIGRQACGGFRSGLRTLAHYIADNSQLALSHAEARDFFRPLLAAPTGATP